MTFYLTVLRLAHLQPSKLIHSVCCHHINLHFQLSDNPTFYFYWVSFCFSNHDSTITDEPCLLVRLLLLINIWMCLVHPHCFSVVNGLSPTSFSLTWISIGLHKTSFDIQTQNHVSLFYFFLKSIIFYNNYLIWIFAIEVLHLGYKLYED